MDGPLTGSTRMQKLAVLWLALWFGVIVPGHKRGLVLLPGGNPNQTTSQRADEGKPCPLAAIMARSGSCCPSSRPAPSDDAPLPVSHCAVCYLTGVLDVPPPPDFAPKPTALLAVLSWPVPQHVQSIETSQTYLGRAPPIG